MNKIKIKSLIIVTFSIIIFTLIICHADGKATDPRFYGDTFDWDNSGPLEFIEILKNKQNEVCPTYAIYGFHDKWVKEKNISQLIGIIDSKEPCANVYSILSSFLDCNVSTVGKEAAYIIQGFRSGRYPSDLNSGRADINIDEIKSWWKSKFKKQQ